MKIKRAVDSTNLKEVAYAWPERIMVVSFHNGGTYSYEGVGLWRFLRLMAARSKGSYFQTIRNDPENYPYKKVS